MIDRIARRPAREGGRGEASESKDVTALDPLETYGVITIAFLVLGILALAFGADSRDSFEDDWRSRR